MRDQGLVAALQQTTKRWMGVLARLALRLRRGFYLRWVLPGLEKSTAFVRRQGGTAPEFNAESWKQKALDDFTVWLEQAPESPGDQKIAPDACDLFALMTEFVALRQEIRLQNREQHSVIRAQQAVGTNLQATGELVVRLSASLEKLQGQLVEEARVKSFSPFLEVRDALVRGLAAAKRASRPPRWPLRAPKGLDAIAQGYAMALRRFDHALAQVDVTPIQTEGQPFDPALMQAVAQDENAAQPSGTVLAEQAGGFMRGGRVLRPAQVVVNK